MTASALLAFALFGLVTPESGGGPVLPPPEDQARAALEKSPRHGEWIDVKGGRTPSRSGPGSSIPSARTRRASSS
jgi:hypothetical protein